MKTICTTVPFTQQERTRITAAGRIVCDGTYVSFRALVRRLTMKAVEQIEKDKGASK